MTDSFGGYRLERLLGRGGMAEVYVATHFGAAGFERSVCIKQILPYVAEDPEFRSQFLREVSLAGKLCHSNLVQVFDCVEAKERLGMVMELVDGLDLKAVVRRLRARGQGFLPAGLVAYIAGQMLTGLHFAHGQRIVHRDISPHNVMVSRQGEVKIADFGVAKALLTHASKTNDLRGKLAYMSPEQARGKAVDFRTDLFSAGLVLYELLCGERYFQAANQWDLVFTVTSAGQPSIKGVEPRLAGLIERLLAPNVDERFQSAEQALSVLPPWEVVGPVGARELARLVATLTDQDREVRSQELEPTATIDDQTTENDARRPERPVRITLGPVLDRPLPAPLADESAETYELLALADEGAAVERRPRAFEKLPKTLALGAARGLTQPPTPARRLDPLTLVFAALAAALMLGLGLGLGAIIQLLLTR